MADPEIVNALAKLSDLFEQFLHNSVTGKRNQVNLGEQGQVQLEGIAGLSQAIHELTTDVQGLIRTLGGQPTGVRGRTGQLNASPHQLNYDPFTTDPREHFRYGNIPGAINSFLQSRTPTEFATRKETQINAQTGEEQIVNVKDRSLRSNKAFYGLGAINTALNAVPTIRQEWNNVNAQMQAGIDRRITNPTQLGMLAGYQGPGQEGVISSTGSYLSSLFAAPSLVLSGGANPGMLGNLFGASMSPATQQGWQSQYRAFTRSLNPMDMLSYNQALGINQAVASKGFNNLGQQVSVEDAVTQIVQTTAIDAGTAIDTMDLVIKRLHGDVGDANDLLKTFGSLAIGAGKGVNQFAQEANQVLASLTMQGAQGTGAVQTSAAYSSFTGVSGQAMSQFLNGPQLSGLMAAQIMAGGGKFANPQDMMSLAMGFPQGMGGGQSGIDVFSQQIDSVVSLVDTFKNSGMDQERAIQMAATAMGGGSDTYYKVKQAYTQGPGIVKENKAIQGIRDLKTGSTAYLFGNKRRGQLANEGIGLEAFRGLQGMVKDGGIDFDKINLGDKNYGPGFEEDVKRLYDAKKSGNKTEEDNIINDIENQGKNVDRVIEAANLLMQQGGTGAQGAWTKLAKRYGVTVDVGYERTPGGGLKQKIYNSAEGKMTESEIKTFVSAAKPKLDDLVSSGVINKDTEARWLRMLKDRKMTPDDLLKKVSDRENQKRIKDEGGLSIKLDGDAAKYFKLFQGNGPGSNQRYWQPPDMPGYNNRANG